MKRIKLLASLFVSVLVSGVVAYEAPIAARAGGGQYTLSFNGMRGTGDNMQAKGIWAGNDNGTCTHLYADPTASGGYSSEFSQSGTDTFKGFAWANAAGTAFTEAGTYGVYFRYKTSATNSATSISFEWSGDWLIKKTVSDLTTEWKECYFTMTLTSANFGDGTCLFDINGSAGKVYIDDFSCILIDRKVEENSEIGTLPDIPTKTGFEGTWQIDGEDIASSTLYTYGADKTAEIHYEPLIATYTLTFNGLKGTGDNIHSCGVWPGNDKGTCTNQCQDPTASTGDCGQFTQSGSDTFKGFSWANSAGSAFTEAGTYGVYFRYKTSETNRATSISFEWAGDWLVKKTVSDLTTEWKECYFTMFLTSSILGNGTCIFNISGNQGIAYIDDFSCIYIDRKITENDPIGELPEIVRKTDNIGTWQIDGEDITSSTLYTYGADKTADIHYEEIVSVALDGYESTVKYHETFATGNIVLKVNGKTVTPDEYNYNVDSTVLGVHSITSSYNNKTANADIMVTNNGATPGTWSGEDQATSWSNFFVHETRKEGGACTLADRTARVNALKLIWNNFKAEYNYMIDASKDAFFNSNEPKIVEARNHYLYIISQYEADGIEDFIKNSTNNALERANNTSIFNSFSDNTLLIVVVSIVSISVVGGYFFIKKRKEN